MKLLSPLLRRNRFAEDKRLLAGIVLLLVLPLLFIVLNKTTNFLGNAANENTLEAESGVVDMNAMVHDDATASGGKFVMVGNQPATPEPSPTIPQVANSPTLLESYILTEDVGVGYYNGMKYQPRKFVQGTDMHGGTDNASLLVTNPGVYSGWDVLNTPNSSINRFYSGNNYLILSLNRPAKVAIVWKAVDPANQTKPLATLPTWLQSWSPSGTVTLGTRAYPTYTKSLPAGETPLGGIYDTQNSFANQTYLVLLAEQNSTPSPEPTVPSGLEKPLANQPCPTWVHDQYTTTGPDGKTYATWHPQIDPVYWCYFGHEHGTNPDNFVKGYKVAYNYTATKQGHMHPGEGHVGFKTLVFDDAAGHTWLVTMHFGTGALSRVCNRFHSTDIAVRNTNSSEILADIHIMGDFGQAVEHNTSTLIQPPACPDQGVGVGTRGDGLGQRQIPVHTDGVDGYEPWVVGAKGNILGFKPGWHINTHDAQVICDTVTCANPYKTAGEGSRRFLADASLLGIVAGTNTGTFYTNAMGTALATADDENALKQYVKPGTNIMYPSNGTKCVPIVGWGRKEICLPTTEANARMRAYERENSLQVPN